MTLNDLERCKRPYFAFSTEFNRFEADYITVVEDSAIRYVKYCIPCSLLLSAKTISHSAARSLCDSWASFYIPRSNLASNSYCRV